MSRTSVALAWAALVVGSAAGAGQERPPAEGMPAPRPAAGKPAARPPRPAPIFPHEPFPPPLPAVVDPRAGAWLQVYVPPGECPELVEMRVGKPCLRCTQKLLHPLKAYEWGHFGRCSRCDHAAPVRGDHPAGPEPADLPPPHVVTEAALRRNK